MSHLQVLWLRVFSRCGFRVSGSLKGRPCIVRSRLRKVATGAGEGILCDLMVHLRLIHLWILHPELLEDQNTPAVLRNSGFWL